ncbi:MAG: hypothetical protein ABEJ30_09415 [Halorientalis sp.]
MVRELHVALGRPFPDLEHPLVQGVLDADDAHGPDDIVAVALQYVLVGGIRLLLEGLQLHPPFERRDDDTVLVLQLPVTV